jgi:predicted ABC-type transport system involved in lysophospholipase L1 biosynthesis ATPase subunit
VNGARSMDADRSVNVIEARGLGKRYGGTWALRECTLAVPGGHVAALVGPNGAGKTTLLNLAVGLAAPSAGSVAVLGDPVPPGWEAHPVGLEELALAYLREPGATALPGPSLARAFPLETAAPSEVTR